MRTDDPRELSKTIRMVIEQRKGRKGDEGPAAVHWLPGIVEVLRVVGEAKKIEEEARPEVYRAMCVRVIAILEYGIRESIRHPIDLAAKYGKLPRSVTVKLSAQKLTIADVHDVFSRDITLGELATANASLREPNVAIAYASSLLGVKFGAEIAKYGTPGETLSGQEALAAIEHIEKCIQIRHEAAHGIATNQVLEEGTVVKFCSSTMTFAFVFGTCFQIAFDRLIGIGR